ncbi:MAG: GAF domain-containing protein [Thermodesulfobacteriota bacterium]
MSDYAKPFELLKKIILLSTTPLPIQDKLDQMLPAIKEALGANQTLLLRREKIVENGFLWQRVLERKPFWIEEESCLPKERVHPKEAEFLQPPFACLPLYEKDTFQGLLYIGFPRKRKLSPQEMDLLVLVAKEMGEAIQLSHLKQRMKQASSELTALHEMGKVATSTLKLEELLESIVKTGLKILQAKGGVLRVRDKTTKELKVQWSFGGYHNHPLDEKIAKRVLMTETPFLLNHSGKENPIGSIVCVPLRSKGGILGTLAFYDKETDPSKFDERDFELLLTMANQVSFAIENALTHYETSQLVWENEKRVKELTILWELSKALLTTVNFEHIVQMTLTAITIGSGLGFNRAMLFMVDEKSQSLQGTLAVGPDNAEEAGRIWAALSEEKGVLSDLIGQHYLSADKNSVLNTLVRQIQIPLELKDCILSKTVHEGRPFNIRLPRTEEFGIQTPCERGCALGSEVGCHVGGHLGRDPRVYSFATLPLWGKGKVIGVILVDNLYNQNPITDEDIQILTMFSSQAGLAIENAILYRNLEEVHQRLKETQTFLVHQEKMAALGELSSNIAHEIRNPLVSIGGFARRLHRSIPDDAPEKRYTQTIMTEVSRLEKILSDLLEYTRKEPLAFGEVDLREILEESFSQVAAKLNGGMVELSKEYSEGIPKIMGDQQQLIQVFSNLINNAYEAMKGKGTLSLRVHPVAKNGSRFVRIEMEDTGNGIDPENLHNIFNPFYSTKESGLGLGLPLVYKIIASHHGQIEVDNRPGEGVTFIITFPAVREREK